MCWIMAVSHHPFGKIGDFLTQPQLRNASWERGQRRNLHTFGQPYRGAMDACETSIAKRLTSTKGQGQCGSPAQSMGSKPTCPPGWWCEPRPRKVGQGRAPPCRSHRTGIRGKGSRTCWQPCSRARRSQGECTRTRVQSPWCCQRWRWGSKAHPSIPAPTHGRCPCGSSPKNQGSQDCHQHLLQAEHHRHHLTQEARSTRDSSPMPPRLGCQRWSPGQSSWAVGASGINPKNTA